MASIHISGSVWDKLADIVPNGAADIAEVRVGDQVLTVTRDLSEPTSAARPYAFEGTFEGNILVWLNNDGETPVVVETSENAIGATGFTTFTVNTTLIEMPNSDGYYYDYPFAIAVAQEFDPASADEIAILFWTSVGLGFTQDLDPSLADQISLYVGADTISLTETGADTRLFTAVDPTHGACSVDLTEFTGLDPENADSARADVSVGDIASGAVLEYAFGEFGLDSGEFYGERQIPLTESDVNTRIFEGIAADYGTIRVDVAGFTGVDPSRVDSMGAFVSVSNAWAGSPAFSLQEWDVDSRVFDVVPFGGDADQPIPWDVRIDSVTLGGSSSGGMFESHFIRIYDPSGAPKDVIHVEGSAFTLVPDPTATEAGWYITTEPFVILDEAPQVADGHLVENGDGEVSIHFDNPRWVVGDATFKLVDRFNNPWSFFAGPWYVNGLDGDLDFDRETEGLFRLNLGQTFGILPLDSLEIKITTSPIAGQGDCVYMLSNDDAMLRQILDSQTDPNAPSEIRFWDGKANVADSKDGDDIRNDIGGEWKYLDPKIGTYYVYFNATLANGQINVSPAPMPINVHKRDLFYYDDADRKSNEGGDYFDSGAHAYQLAENYIAQPFTEDGVKYGVGRLIRSRFEGQRRIGDPTWTYPVIYAYGVDGKTFRDVYSRLTARGSVTTVGHGMTDQIKLDGQRFSEFGIDPAGEGRYVLPYLRVHGTEVYLRHCESLTVAGSLKKVLTNEDQGGGVGGGTVWGAPGIYIVQSKLSFTPGNLSPKTDEVLRKWERLYAELNRLASIDAQFLGRSILKEDEQAIVKMANLPIVPGQTVYLQPVPGYWGLPTVSNQGHQMQLLEETAPNTYTVLVSNFRYDELKRVCLEERVTIEGRPVIAKHPYGGLTGTTLETYRPAGNYYVRCPSLGGIQYFMRHIANMYPIEEENGTGRLQNVINYLGFTVDDAGQQKASEWKKVELDYKTDKDLMRLEPYQ